MKPHSHAAGRRGGVEQYEVRYHTSPRASISLYLPHLDLFLPFSIPHPLLIDPPLLLLLHAYSHRSLDRGGMKDYGD